MDNTYTVPTVAEYAAADRAGKSNIRAMADRAMRDAIRRGDIATAVAIDAAMTEWKSNTRSTTADVDWSAIASVRVATLRAAADAIESGAVRPNGVPADVELMFDSSATPDDDTVARIAAEPIKRSEKRPLRSYITDVFASDTVAPNVFYTVAEIARMVESAVPDYGTVSHGAVRNALESNKIPNVRFIDATPDRPRGAMKS